ncbi:MAG TPA: hypothetical protein VMV92_22155 [Streptosporangiaceae bacterium]|nr:hypothetical protein [Streptosporangiaceae bacterium]
MIGLAPAIVIADSITHENSVLNQISNSGSTPPSNCLSQGGTDPSC